VKIERLFHSYEDADDSISWIRRLFGREVVPAQLWRVKAGTPRLKEMAREMCFNSYGPITIAERFESLDCLYPPAYIFNVGGREHIVRKGTAGTWIIPGRKRDELFAGPLVIPGVLEETVEDIAHHDGRALKIRRTGGTALAMDIINPRLLEGDWSIGTNLEKQGVFWSNYPTPTGFEIDHAYLMVKLG